MNKIVVHSNDGTVLKGHSSDFNPSLPYFHLVTVERPRDSVKIWLENQKAVFVVMDFGGDSLHQDAHDFDQVPFSTKHIVVTFNDGEEFYGTSDLSHRTSGGFYIFPVDPDSNTIRAWVVSSSIQRVDVNHQRLPE